MEPQHDVELHKRRRREVVPDPHRQLGKSSHYVLSAYFPTLLTLRQYLIARLSFLRRSQAQDRGLTELQSEHTQGDDPLSKLLDSTLVGLNGDVPRLNPITQDIVEATMSNTLWSGGEGPPQSEVSSR